MRPTARIVWPVAAGLAALLSGGVRAAAPRALAVSAGGPGELRDWDRRIAQMEAAGELVVRWERDDVLVPGRRHLRHAQVHQGVPVDGGEVVQQVAGADTVSVFGTLYGEIALDPRPALTPDQAVAVVEARAGVDLGPARVPELRVLPLPAGG
jgi:hypothetical protein